MINYKVLIPKKVKWLYQRIKCVFKKHHYIDGKYTVIGAKVKIKGQGWVRRGYIVCECCNKENFIGYIKER